MEEREKEARGVISKFMDCQTNTEEWYDAKQCALIALETANKKVDEIFRQKFQLAKKTKVPIDYAEGVIDMKQVVKQHYQNLIDVIREL